MSSSEKNWLVKSSTRILGPFTFDELVSELRSRHVSIIDEVRQTEGRWSYIRENSQLLEIVKNIRDEQDSISEDTMTQSIAQHTMTRTDSISMPDELTPTPASGVDQAGRENSDMKDVTPSTPGTRQNEEAGKAFLKSYGAADDARLLEKIQSKSKMLSWALLGGALIVVGVVAVTLFNKDRARSLGYEELLGQALRYRSLGLYERALQSYQKAVKIKEPEFSAQLRMADVLISEDRQTLIGRRILERALVQEGLSRAEIVEAYLGIATSYMMDGDLKQAEDILQKAIGHEPHNISALLNLAIIQFKKGNYFEAMNSFDNIYRKNSSSAMALYGKAISAVERAEKLNNPTFLETLVPEMKSQIKKTAYLRQELLLLIVYAQSLMGNVDGMNQAVVQFLSEGMGQTRNYIHSLQVDWRFTQWDYLEKYCDKAYRRQPPHAELKALRAVCLLEVNRDTEASKLLEEALAEAPKDPYILLVQAGYLTKMGRLPEAQALLKLPELSRIPGKNLLLGQICMSKHDPACAQQEFTENYNSDKRSASTFYGLAWGRLQSGDRSHAYDYIRIGLQVEPNFLPLLELRDQVESE